MASRNSDDLWWIPALIALLLIWGLLAITAFTSLLQLLLGSYDTWLGAVLLLFNGVAGCVGIPLSLLVRSSTSRTPSRVRWLLICTAVFFLTFFLIGFGVGAEPVTTQL